MDSKPDTDNTDEQTAQNQALDDERTLSEEELDEIAGGRMRMTPRIPGRSLTNPSQKPPGMPEIPVSTDLY